MYIIYLFNLEVLNNNKTNIARWKKRIKIWNKNHDAVVKLDPPYLQPVSGWAYCRPTTITKISILKWSILSITVAMETTVKLRKEIYIFKCIGPYRRAIIRVICSTMQLLLQPKILSRQRRTERDNIFKDSAIKAWKISITWIKGGRD